MSREPLSAEEVRKVASLARLALSDEEVARFGVQLSAVLDYMERMRELDLAGVEPLANVGETVNRLDDDEPGPTLPVEALARMAPQMFERFVRIPKVLEEGGGA